MKKETWSNKVGTINFAKYLTDLNNSVPQSRYIEKEQRKEQQIPEHISKYLETLQLWNLNKQSDK